ncbi:ATPase [Pseudovibrio exalbescens]|uniref:ATP12 family chaperone protein n=1 Tax=Pseudovibrio exalbescens TaxID=197461 RepID=UPI0023670444|nr:ATP12 family protein [Pseudovibrio exalbescens]MDD7910650.1 ATPase [Pseudovibrio exalbescens]
MRDIFEQIAEDIAKGPADPVERAKQLSRRELPKRFYEQVRVEAVEGGYAVLLDGRSVKTPSRKQLMFDEEYLAEAVAAEWEIQEENIDPITMPLTRIAHSAIDAVADRFSEVADEVARYSGNDYLFYRAEAPQELVKRQSEAWDPVVAWGEEMFEGQFKLTTGLIHQQQDETVTANIREGLNQFTPLELSAIHTITSISGSALLALAAAHGAFSEDEIWKFAHIDEDWNIEHWGQDSEAARVRRFKNEEFSAACLILNKPEVQVEA